MYESLKQTLQSCGVDWDALGGCVTIYDHWKTNCQFLISYFLCKSLLKGRKVLLVSLHETFEHNTAIAAKLGFNLQSYIDKGKLIVIDGTELMVEADENNPEDPFTFKFSTEKRLHNFYLLVKTKLNDWRSCTDEPFTILVDRISLFVTLMVPLKEIQLLVKRIYALIEPLVGTGSQPMGSLIVSTFYTDKLGEDHKVLAHWLSSLSSFTVALDPLKSGRSRDIDGNLRIIPQSTGVELKYHTFHFSVSDKNVTIFAPGMAKSVI